MAAIWRAFRDCDRLFLADNVPIVLLFPAIDALRPPMGQPDPKRPLTNDCLRACTYAALPPFVTVATIVLYLCYVYGKGAQQWQQRRPSDYHQNCAPGSVAWPSKRGVPPIA